MIWHTPVNAESHELLTESPTTSSHASFSPWDLLKYENLSYDHITNFIWEICYGDTLQSILSERQIGEVMDFVAFLARNGLPSWDMGSKEELEKDIERLFLDDAEEDIEEGTSWWFSNFDGKGCSIVPAIYSPGYKGPEVVLCKGWLSKKWNKTKKFVKKHKKTIIVAAVVVVVATVVIIATQGAATEPALEGATTAISGAAASEKKDKKHVNKPGEVVFQEDQPPSPQLAETTQNVSIDSELYHPQLEPVPKLTSPINEMLALKLSEVKDELSEQIPDGTLNIPQSEEQSFWLQAKTKAKESGSWISHNLVDGVAKLAETYSDIGRMFEDDYEPKTRPTSEFMSEDVIPFSDSLHQKIDEKFGTNYAGQYGSAARNMPPPGTMGELLKDLGKDVAFCFVPVPGSQLNKLSKVSKTARAVVETAKAVGVVAATGSLIDAPRPIETPNTPVPIETKMPVPREQGNISVYRSFNAKTGEVNYVGITNNLPRRYGEQYHKKGIKIQEIQGLSNLTKSDARAVEQALIEIHLLEKEGGTLTNRINSIAQTNPKYAESVSRGAEILKEIDYDGMEEIIE